MGGTRTLSTLEGRSGTRDASCKFTNTISDKAGYCHAINTMEFTSAAVSSAFNLSLTVSSLRYVCQLVSQLPFPLSGVDSR